MPAKPVIRTLDFWRGNSAPFEFRLKDKVGNPFDLTGYDLVMTIEHDGGKVKKSLSAGSMTSQDRTSGVVKAQFEASETRAITIKQRPGQWELELISADSTYQKTLVAGPITIEGGINDD